MSYPMAGSVGQYGQRLSQWPEGGTHTIIPRNLFGYVFIGMHLLHCLSVCLSVNTTEKALYRGGRGRVC